MRVDEYGVLRVLLVTTRETKRLIIPKGWPMKGLKDWEAAGIEARQEAGLIGRVGRKPIGTFSYWKRRDTHFDLVDVSVFSMVVTKELDDWREKGQRQIIWLPAVIAADRVDEPALADLIRGLKVSQ